MHWQWPVLLISTRHIDGCMGRLFNHYWPWSGHRSSNGKLSDTCFAAMVPTLTSCQPLMAIQSAVSQDEMSQAMAFAVWCQYIGPTVFLTLYNTIFDTSLRSQLQAFAPGANPDFIIAAGATRFRSFVSPQDLPGVLQAFSTSLDHTFYLQAGAGVVAWFTAWGMGWKVIGKDKDASFESTAVSNSKSQDDNGGEDSGKKLHPVVHSKAGH